MWCWFVAANAHPLLGLFKGNYRVTRRLRDRHKFSLLWVGSCLTWSWLGRRPLCWPVQTQATMPNITATCWWCFKKGQESVVFSRSVVCLCICLFLVASPPLHSFFLKHLTRFFMGLCFILVSINTKLNISSLIWFWKVFFFFFDQLNIMVTGIVESYDGRVL